LWDRYGDGDLKKQLEPEYLMKSAEEKARLEYKSISISQSTPKPIENRIEEGLNSKKRKRDELESIKNNQKNLKVIRKGRN